MQTANRRNRQYCDDWNRAAYESYTPEEIAESYRRGICPVCEGNLPHCGCARRQAWARWKQDRSDWREDRYSLAACRAKCRLWCWYARGGVGRYPCNGAFDPDRLVWNNGQWPSIYEWIIMPRHVAEYFATTGPMAYRADEGWIEEFNAWWKSKGIIYELDPSLNLG